MSCPYCGQPAPSAVPSRQGSGAPETENRAGPIARPPRPAGNGTVRAVYTNVPQNAARTRRIKKKKQSGPKTSAVIIFILIAAIAAAVVAMLLNGSLSKEGKNAVGKRFIELLLDGETDEAMALLPYDPESVCRDRFRAELENDFGGDFEKFYAKYKPMGIVASDFSGFVRAAYSKIYSEFRLGFVGLANGGCEVSAVQESERAFSDDETSAYREGLRRDFERSGADISRYLKTDLITDVCEVKYLVTVTASDGGSQTAEYTLNVLTYDGKRAVIPGDSGLFARHGSVAGNWTFTRDGEIFTVVFASDGTGSAVYGERTVPLTYRFVGTDGLFITCAAFGEGETVCRYSLSEDTLTLTMTDGTLSLVKSSDG